MPNPEYELMKTLNEFVDAKIAEASDQSWEGHALRRINAEKDLEKELNKLFRISDPSIDREERDQILREQGR